MYSSPDWALSWDTGGGGSTPGRHSLGWGGGKSLFGVGLLFSSGAVVEVWWW